MTQAWLQTDAPDLVLASTSAIRRTLLEAAGLTFEVIRPGLDETAMRSALTDVEPADVAEVLARAKAETVSRDRKAAVVIGADQVLELQGNILAKPENAEGARRLLLDLQGRRHALHSAVAVARDGETVWSHVASVHLTMRALNPEFIGRYLAAAGHAALASVGGYQLESLGVQLFSRVEGDYFAVLGLPLLPLLEALRSEGAITA